MASERDQPSRRPVRKISAPVQAVSSGLRSMAAWTSPTDGQIFASQTSGTASSTIPSPLRE